MTAYERMYALVERVLFRRFPALYRVLYSAYKWATDRRERQLYVRLIKPGMTVVDIGANIGVYTRFFAKRVGAAGEVHAFEPGPENFSMLSAALAGSRGIYLNQAAVSDRSGEKFLYLSSALNVDHRSYDAGDNRRRIPVKSLALDDYFLPGRRVDFIKMDIQGAEYHALLGMRRVLAENRKASLVLEYYPAGLHAANANWGMLKDFLVGLGFSLHSTDLTPLAASQEPRLGRSGYTNIVALRG